MLLEYDRDAAERPLPYHGVARGHRIFRVLANQWTVVRTAEGWRIAARKRFPMDGSAPAQALLRQVVER